MKRFLTLLACALVLCLGLALFSCDKECEHDYSETVSVSTEPTCTEKGAGEVKCSKCESTKSVWIDPLGHDFQEDYWSWSNSYDSATLTFRCSREGCGVTSGSAATILTERISDGTCESSVYNTHIATVKRDGQTYTDTKTVETPPIGHNYDTNGICTRCQGSCSHESAASKTLNLADSGLCASSYGYLECPDCDKQFALQDSASLCILNENGVCMKCGVKYTYNSASVEDGCITTIKYTTKISKGNTVYLNAEAVKKFENHTYISKPLDLGTNCFNLVKINVCVGCDKMMLDSITEIGCDKHIMPTATSTAVGGVNHEITEIDCDDCSLKFIIDTVDLSTQCAVFVKKNLKIYKDGTLLYDLNSLDEPLREYHTLNKTHIFRDEDDKNCLVGALCIENCSNCDYASSYIVNEHRDLFVLPIDISSLDGLCEGRINKQICGACGFITRVEADTACSWVNDDSLPPPMGGIDSTSIVYCEKCPLKQTVVSSVPMDECAKPVIVTMSFGEIEIITYNDAQTFHIAPMSTTKKIGSSSKCGATWTSSYCESCIYGETSLSFNTCSDLVVKTFYSKGDFIQNSDGGYIEVLSCSCGKNAVVNFDHIGSLNQFNVINDTQNNKITYSSPNGEFVITIKTVTDEGAPACNNNLSKYMDIEVNGVKRVSGGILSYGEASASHTNEVVGMYAINYTCLDGSYVLEKCTVCDTLSVTETAPQTISGSHKTYKVHDFRDFPDPLCEGHYIEIYSCPCGWKTSYTLDYENLSHNGEHFYCEECQYIFNAYDTESVIDGCYYTNKTVYGILSGESNVYEFVIDTKIDYHTFTAEITEISDTHVSVLSKCEECGLVMSNDDFYFFRTQRHPIYSSYYYEIPICFEEGGTRYIWSDTEAFTDTTLEIYEFDGYHYNLVACDYYGSKDGYDFLLEYDFKAGIQYLLVPVGKNSDVQIDITVMISENHPNYYKVYGLTGNFFYESEEYYYRIIYCADQGKFYSIERSKKD